MKQLIIWHLCSNRWNSAITEYALSAALSLQKQGAKTYFTPLKYSPAEKRALQNAFTVHALPNFGIFQLFNILKFYFKIRPDFIFVYEGKEAFLLNIISKFLSCRIIRFKGNAIYPRKKYLSWFFRFDTHCISSYLAPSQIIANHLKEVVPSHKKIHFVRLGSNDQIFSFKNNSPPPLRPRILIFGRLDPIKGHAKFIRIFAAFLNSYKTTYLLKPPPCLHIVGLEANISKAYLQAQAYQFGLKESEDIIIECKKDDDPASLMRQATLGVVSSLGSEWICRVAQEFLLCGTPVLVSGVGSLDEVLFSDFSGANYKGLSDHEIIAKLYETYELACQLTRDQRKQLATSAKELFSLQTMGRELIKFLDEFK